MQSMFFHPVFAWSLVDDLWSSRVFSENFLHGGYEQRLNALRARRVVSDQTKRSARQMFVFTENVILPPAFDFPELMQTSLYKTGAITWGKERHREVFKFTTPESIDLSNDIAVQILPFIEDPEIGLHEINRVIEFWNKSRIFEEKAFERLGCEGNFLALQGLGIRDAVAAGNQETNQHWHKLPPNTQSAILELFANDPEPERVSLGKKIYLTAEAYFFAVAAKRLAERDVPTFASTRMEATIPNVKIEEQNQENTEYLVRLYFDNVAFPAPETAKDALNYRESERVENWRKKILDWQANLVSGKTTEAEIIDELNEANGYIVGSKYIKTTLGQISPWVTAPLAIATYFMSELPLHAEISAALTGHVILERFGELVETSVLRKNSLEANWLMLPPMK